MIDRQSVCTTRAHERSSPGSCGGLFSEGFPTGTRGNRLFRSFELASRLGRLGLVPFALGAALPAAGSPTAFFQLFESSIAGSRLQLTAVVPCSASLRLPENSNGPGLTQVALLVGKIANLWESPSTPRPASTSAKLRSTFTKCFSASLWIQRVQKRFNSASG